MRYIKEKNSTNFIYPNNQIAEYDVDIIHEINDNKVDGSVGLITTDSVGLTEITFTVYYTWNKNSGEVFIDDGGNMSVVSVHVLPASINHFKPWRTVALVTTTGTTQTTITDTVEVTITASDYGLTQFVDGNYYFEIRFIGHRYIYPITSTIEITALPT